MWTAKLPLKFYENSILSSYHSSFLCQSILLCMWHDSFYLLREQTQSERLTFCQAIRTEWFSCFVSVFSVFHFARFILFCKCMEMRGSRWRMGQHRLGTRRDALKWRREGRGPIKPHFNMIYIYIFCNIYLLYSDNAEVESITPAIYIVCGKGAGKWRRE